MIFNLTQPVLDSAPKFTYTGTYEYIDDGDGNWRIKFLTSGVFTPLRGMTIDAFLVGGGAGGMNDGSACFGGGGGYTTTVKKISLPANSNFDIIIGSGGAPNGNGGETSGLGVTAAGGSGKNGGSGGGAFGSPAGDGGSDGSDGGDGSLIVTTVKGGTGQGTTTKEFGEANGDLYSGGGGGGSSNTNTIGEGGLGGGGNGAYTINGENGQENTGGGGGGTYSSSKNGGYGGSGIVIIRKHKEMAA